MSWASHNPEAYDEMCVEGIANKLETEVDDVYAASIVEHIKESCPKAFSELCSWAFKEISEAQSSFLTRGM